MNNDHFETEDALVASLVRGDVKAFNHFFNEFYAPLFYYCRNIVTDEEEAKDIVLSSFYKFWDKRAGFQNYPHARSFLYMVVKNAGADYLKVKGRTIRREHEFSLSAELLEDEKDYLELEAAILKRIYREIEQLPGKCRQIFELSFLEGKQVPEIAELLQISASNVSSQRSRAIQLLRIALTDSPLALLYLSMAFFK